MADNRTHPGSEEMLAQIEANEAAELRLGRSPTLEEIAASTQTQAIRELAKRLYPEDGHETEAENAADEVFQLLVMTARVYTHLSAGHPGMVDDHWSTLQGLAENLSDNGVTYEVTEK